MGKFDIVFSLIKEARSTRSFITRPSKSIGDIAGLRLAPELKSDTVYLSNIKKVLSKEEALSMKPTEFTSLLEKRTDISSAIKTNITTPESLRLYDEISSLEEIKKLPLEEQEYFFKILLYGNYGRPGEASAQLEVLPKLIKKGYNPRDLAEIRITEANKNQVEYIFSRTDLAEKSLACRIEQYRATSKNPPKAIESTIAFWKRSFNPARELARICNYVNDKNIKYLDECIELTGSSSDLAYWGKDTSKIIKEFGQSPNMLDRIFRRGHTYQSVKQIFGEEKITPLTERLLEFKNYKKFKDIGLEEYKQLSPAEKKEFLSGFISALTPKEVCWSNQHGLSENFELLQSRMKIFKELNPETQETFITSYQNTLRTMLNEIPASERQLVRTKFDTNYFVKEYREANPIPPLVDDISKTLSIQEVTVNGRKIKVTQMDRETSMGVATHRMPCDEAILNIEALEITDPKMFLCTGQKAGSRKLNFNDGDAALIIKPRRGNDLHVQAHGDIDSGNNVTKNIYNFENIMLPGMGNHCQAIDLVPNLIKKELNLSQIEYTTRMRAVKDATTLQEIGKIDPELELAIRKVIAENRMYEGLVRPEVMGVAVSSKTPLEKLNPDILSYCERRGVPIVQIDPAPAKPNPAITKPPIIEC